MLPTLLEVPLPGGGVIAIHTYGVAAALGCVAAGRVLWHFASLRGVPPLRVLRGGLLVGLAGFLGAKLAALLQHGLDAVAVLRSGGMYQAGFLSGLVAGVWYVRRIGLPVWRVLDTGATAAAVGHGIGRLGCFAAGCCYGLPTSLPWGVVFTRVDRSRLATAPLGVPLHPTQLYEAGGELLPFAALFRLNGRKRYQGQVIGSYLLGYGALRFLLEFLRGDPRPTLFAGTLSLPQLVSLAMAAAGLLIFWRRRERGRGAAVAGDSGPSSRQGAAVSPPLPGRRRVH